MKVNCLPIFGDAIFGHINYDSLRMMENNGVFKFSTISRNLQQCEACILGKHSEKNFHDSTSRTCRKLELIHYDLSVPIPVPFYFGNKYIMTFINEYTRMYWAYLLKHKSQAFETFNFCYLWIENET
jgi:hypothetical protein